jgi:hypothetical protein
VSALNLTYCPAFALAYKIAKAIFARQHILRE